MSFQPKKSSLTFILHRCVWCNSILQRLCGPCVKKVPGPFFKPLLTQPSNDLAFIGWFLLSSSSSCSSSWSCKGIITFTSMMHSIRSHGDHNEPWLSCFFKRLFVCSNIHLFPWPCSEGFLLKLHQSHSVEMLRSVFIQLCQYKIILFYFLQVQFPVAKKVLMLDH